MYVYTSFLLLQNVTSENVAKAFGPNVLFSLSFSFSEWIQTFFSKFSFRFLHLKTDRGSCPPCLSLNFSFNQLPIPTCPNPSPFPHRTDLSLLPPFYSLPFIPFSFCLFFPHPRHFQGRGGGRKGVREGRKGRGGQKGQGGGERTRGMGENREE